MKRQSGFTLLELLVSMSIIGIMASAAMPRFSGVMADARHAKMQGLAGAMRITAMMAHLKPSSYMQTLPYTWKMALVLPWLITTQMLP